MQNKLRVRRQWMRAGRFWRLIIAVRNFPILWGRDHEPELGIYVWQLGFFCVMWVADKTELCTRPWKEWAVK